MRGAPLILRAGSALAGLALMMLPFATLAGVAGSPYPLRMTEGGHDGSLSCRGTLPECEHLLSWAWLGVLVLLVAGGLLALYGALAHRGDPILLAGLAPLAAWVVFAIRQLDAMAGPQEAWWEMLQYPATLRGLLALGALAALLSGMLLAGGLGLRGRAKV